MPSAFDNIQEIFRRLRQRKREIETNEGAIASLEASSALAPRGMGVTFDGGGAVLEVASEVDLTIGEGFTISEWFMVCEPSGSIEMEVEGEGPVGAFPDNLQPITASSKPKIVAAQQATDNVLTGWDTVVADESKFRFSILSVTDVERVFLLLRGVPTP